eukprot:66271-Rhodomonas_salina.2
MQGLAYLLEDLTTVVVQPIGKSSLVRLKLRGATDNETLSRLLLASPQSPTQVEFMPGNWDETAGHFEGSVIARDA